MPKASQDKWQQAQRDILDRLDIRSVYIDLGVDVTGTEPNGNGWLEARAYGRVDNSPSAGVNVSNDHPGRGRYKEFTGDGANLSLFDFAVLCNRFPDFISARDHFAKLAGVKLPNSKPPKKPEDSLELRDYNSALVLSWCMKKPGISETAVKLCGGRIATESNKHTVVALPVFSGDHLTNDDPCGWVCWNVTGRPLEIFQGKGIPPKQIKMKTASGSKAGWMGRAGLNGIEQASTVWVTEGPSDMLGLVTAITEQLPEADWSQHAVICNSAGAMERADLDSVAFLAGKRVVVVPDCDSPGQIGCKRRAEAIAEVAERVLFCRLPYEITENHGKDLRDYLCDEHTFTDLQQLAALGEVIRAKAPAPSMSDKPEPDGAHIQTNETVAVEPAGSSNGVPTGDPAATYLEQQIMDLIGIDVLGELDGGKIKVFSAFHRKTDIIQDIGKLNYHRLVQIGGPAVKAHVMQSTESVPGMYSLQAVKESIALLAGYRRVEGNEAGIGCWQGLDEDGEQSSAIVLVGAGEAAVRNGSPGLKKIVKPRYGGRLLNISTSDAWYDYAELNDLVLTCDQQFSEETVTELENLFARWRWAHQGQAPKILAGLVIATWLQTIWNWRPQCSISGKSNSGKSTLFKSLADLFGRLALTSSGSTAAGIRQAITNSAAVVLLDEFENGKHRNEILEMLRASGRGDRVLRGTTGHKGLEFTLRHIVWTAGIESGLKREPDKNRFIQIELIKPAAVEMGRLNVPAPDELRHLGQKALAVGLKHIFKMKELASALRVLKFPGINERVVECYSVPAACYSVAMGQELVGAPHEVLGRMVSVFSKEEDMDDERQLLSDILETEVRLPKGEVATVAQIFSNRGTDPSGLYRVEACGVGIITHNDMEHLFVSHRATSRYLLKGTNWENQNIDEILIRVPGAVKIKKRLAGKHPWGVAIPFERIGEL